MTKTIAYFLPQYHEIPENNKWWGDGFTEWTNLNKAKKLYKSHNFITPLNNYQYNLLDSKTVQWQTKLMNDYKVDGLCYYHYWFKGKKLLNKPAENLLLNKNIKQDFMFMWANHDWTKSWVGKKDLLIKQEYGDKSDWMNHINYLIKFFKDDRYIKLNNKPVFQIYIPKDIKNPTEMFKIWRSECIKHGFDGLYLIENIDSLDDLQNHNNDIYDSATLMEHSISMNYWMQKNNLFKRAFNKLIKLFSFKHHINSISYKKLSKISLEIIKNTRLDQNINYGIMTGWDNTPRYGSRGYILEGSNPKNFELYFSKLYKQSKKDKRNFLFISCWNEWCEGMCLEPSSQFGLKFLEVIKKYKND